MNAREWVVLRLLSALTNMLTLQPDYQSHSLADYEKSRSKFSKIIPLSMPTFFVTCSPVVCIDSERDSGKRSCSNWKPDSEYDRPDRLCNDSGPSESSKALREVFESTESREGSEGEPGITKPYAAEKALLDLVQKNVYKSNSPRRILSTYGKYYTHPHTVLK